MEKAKSDVLLALYEEEQALLNKLNAVRNAIIALGGAVSDHEKAPFRPLKVPESWSTDLPKIKKISYAIKELGGEASSSEIAEKIHELDGSIDWILDSSSPDKRNIIMLVAYLYKKGRLKVRREGGKNIYSLGF